MRLGPGPPAAMLGLLAALGCGLAESPRQQLWRCELTLQADGRLGILLRLPDGVRRLERVPGRAGPRELEVWRDRAWQPLPIGEDGAALPVGPEELCLRYRLPEGGSRSLDTLPVPAAGCLLLAPEARPAVLLLRADLPEGWRLATSLFPALPEERAALGVGPAGGPVWRLPVSRITDAPWTACTKRPLRTLAIGGASIQVLLPAADSRLDDEAAVAWIEEAAAHVSGWLGRFPVPHLLVRVQPRRGRGTFGRTFGAGGARIDAWVGTGATPEDLSRDWIMAHEMSHLALPLLDRRHHWLEEGLATYLETMVRVHAGALSEEDFWERLVRRLPQGQPESGDQGLDHTRTWGRTYWGGALFWFVADLEIRRRSQDRHDLRDALAAIVARGGSMAVSWPVERVLQVGDEATGVPVLAELHAAWKDAPVKVDLQGIWKSLGAQATTSGLRLDDSAPEAGRRRAMAGQDRSGSE